MALPNPRAIYGVQSVSPYSRTDGTFYGILKVIEGSSLNMKGALVKLEGGSQKFPWAVETGLITAEVDLKVSEFPDFLWTLFFGQAPTASGSSATGSISAPVNKLNTSVVSAAGIAGLAITPSTGAANLKFGKYVIKAASPTTVNVYIATDADMQRGTSGTYVDGTLLINAAPLTITAAGTTSIAGWGIDITGGAGPIAMVTGDTATFEVLPPSNSSSVVSVGSASAAFPEFGMIAMAVKNGSKELFELDIYRCKAVGFPMGFAMNAFSKADIKIDAFYDSAKDAVFRSRWVQET